MKGIVDKHRGYAVVDVVGVGAGVVDMLREGGYDIRAFNAGERSVLLDRSGELGFVNRRSAAWWTLRELLDPATDSRLALPPDDLLTGDLVTPSWRTTSAGRIQVEGKDDILPSRPMSAVAQTPMDGVASPDGGLRVPEALSLNAEQAAAVTFEGGQCLVLAGAGAGKTRTIIGRAATLLGSGVPAERILVVAFARKAAREIAARLGAIYGHRLPVATQPARGRAIA